MLEEIKRIIELSPARQAQVGYNATLKPELGKLTVILEPTLDHFLLDRTGDRDMIGLYSSMVFHTGLTAGSIEHWCRENNKKFEMSVDIPHEAESDLAPNFLNLLRSNTDFIINETVSYLQNLNDKKLIKEGESYDYDSSKCVRDLIILMNALLFDLCYDTNQRTCQIMREFWNGNQRQVRGIAEKFAYDFLEELVVEFISKNKPANLYQKNNVKQQIFLETQIEMNGVEKFSSMIKTFKKVIEEGTQYVPLVYNPFPRTKDTIKVVIYE